MTEHKQNGPAAATTNTNQKWNAADFIDAVRKTAQTAMQEPDSGFKITSPVPGTRKLIRELVLKELNDFWTETSSDPEKGWWQLHLKNGSVVRVCGED